MCTWKFIARPVIEKGAGISFLPVLPISFHVSCHALTLCGHTRGALKARIDTEHHKSKGKRKFELFSYRKWKFPVYFRNFKTCAIPSVDFDHSFYTSVF